MTFPIFGSAFAPDIADCPAVAPGTVSFNATATDLAALFGLDRLPAERQLVCRWTREVDGRIACHWEPDIVPRPQR
jgi:hypothetical protein